MIALEFSTTAMCRPDILRRTYKSFCSKLQDVDFQRSTLYLNVDPLPSRAKAEDTVAVATDFFGTVICNTPSRANFTAAVKWCWSNVTGPYVFNLEDDWVLKNPVSIKTLCDKLNKPYKESKDNVVQVYLRAYSGSNKLKICLSPSLLSGDLVRRAVKIFDTNLNPEIQLRGKVVQGVSVFHAKPIAVKDIGRSWLKNSKFKHPPKKANFTSWVNKK